MSQARIWNLRFNLDIFNSIAPWLANDDERAQCFSGLSLGVNRGRTREGATPAFALGFDFGTAMREEAEALRALNVVNGAKGGRPGGRKQKETQGSPAGKPEVNQSLTQSIYPVTSNPETGNPSTSTPKAKRKNGAPAKAASPSMKEILGMDKEVMTSESYWQLVGTFGGDTKNPSPTASASLYVAALGRGVAKDLLQERAEALLASRGSVRFMPKLAVWLETEMYLNPIMEGHQQNFQANTNSGRLKENQAYLSKLAAQRAGNGGIPK
jgi:hypothetical protein